MNIEPIAAKWLAFGWHAIEIDGCDMGAILQAGKPEVLLKHFGLMPQDIIKATHQDRQHKTSQKQELEQTRWKKTNSTV